MKFNVIGNETSGTTFAEQEWKETRPNCHRTMIGPYRPRRYNEAGAERIPHSEGVMHSRRGFTLVELLVVIAVIAMLVALLIPAVQAAREAGRRMTCANHMKQIALAVANYANAHDDRLPPIAMSFFGPYGRRPLPKGRWKCDAWAPRQSHGWRVAVLPFLEKQNLYDQFDFSGGVVTEPNFPAISQVLPLYQCPSTPGYPRSTLQSNESISGRIPDDLTVGSQDYGVPGRPWQAGKDENGDFISFVPAWVGTKNYPGVAAYQGHACGAEVDHGRGGKLVWVTDGLSKTTLAHERAYLPNFYDREGVPEWYPNALCSSQAVPLTIVAGGTAVADVDLNRWGSASGTCPDQSRRVRSTQAERGSRVFRCPV